MAIRIEATREQVYGAFKQCVASATRAEKAATNPGIKLLLQKDIAELTKAMNTLTEIK